MRWPGYAAKVSVLWELGLLADAPVLVDGAPVVPKRLLDAVLYPRVRLDPDEVDLALVRVEVLGTRRGEPWHARAETIDRRADGFTAMARTPASRPRSSPA